MRNPPRAVFFFFFQFILAILLACSRSQSTYTEGILYAFCRWMIRRLTGFPRSRPGPPRTPARSMGTRGGRTCNHQLMEGDAGRGGPSLAPPSAPAPALYGVNPTPADTLGLGRNTLRLRLELWSFPSPVKSRLEGCKLQFSFLYGVSSLASDCGDFEYKGSRGGGRLAVALPPPPLICGFSG